MKFTLILDTDREEEVVVYCHKKTELTDAIEQILSDEICDFLGYTDTECKRLEIAEIYCFIVDSNKIYAICENGKYRLKSRLYKIEEKLPEYYVKINQSCIINIKKIDSFASDITGAIKVKLKNGFTDYVSRRNLKSVKKRLGV